jgi:hypothetical protein
METNNNVDALLQSLTAEYGEELTTDGDAINNEMAAEAETYKGLGIKILSIVGGILATGFFLVFVSMCLTQIPGVAIFVGLLIMAGAIGLNKTSNSTILDTALIASYLASYAMILYGLSRLHTDDNLVAAVLLALAVITMVITSGYMLNFFSVLIAAGCLFSFVNINNAYQFIHVLTAGFAIIYAWLCLSEAQIVSKNPPVNTRYMALRNGALFSFTALLAYLGIGDMHSRYFDNGYISATIIIAVTAFLLHHVVKNNITDSKNRLLAYILGGMALLSTIFAPAICGALLIVLLSFQTGHRTGMVVGVTGLVYFTGQYYYDLHYTLLVKSEMMMASGLIFLLAWFILKKQLKRYEQN